MDPMGIGPLSLLHMFFEFFPKFQWTFWTFECSHYDPMTPPNPLVGYVCKAWSMNIRIGRKTREETYFLPEFWLLFWQSSYLIPPYVLPSPGKMRKTSSQKKSFFFVGQAQDWEGETRELNGLVRNNLSFESICVIQINTCNHKNIYVHTSVDIYIYIHNYIHTISEYIHI